MKNNLREKKKLQSRETILAASAVEFKNRGFANTSIANIMTAANLGVGTFYNYFESKEELLMTLAKKLFTQVEAAVHEKARQKISSLELLQIASRLTAELLDENRFILPLLDIAAKHSDVPSEKSYSPKFKEIFNEIISAGQSSGEIRADIPTDLISEMFHSIYQAAAFSKLEISFAENVRLKVKILLDGIKVN